MLELIRDVCGPYYLHIKFIHLIAVMAWSWSTAVAYTSFLKPAYIKWKRNPDNDIWKERRNWAFEQFDRGVVIEHVAFPLLLLSDALLYIIGNWNLEFKWLVLKLCIIAAVFIPMELLDYYLSHMGGNKFHIKKSGDTQRYERFIQHHWLFFRITTPLIGIFMPLVIFIAVTKPTWL